MTDTLLKPDDTGEIRLRDPGQTTMNLAPYAAGLPPVLRRPDATTELPIIDGGCRTVVPNDEDFTTAPAEPPKLPPPPPPAPQVDDRPLAVVEEIIWAAAALHPRDMPVAYVGRHRKPEDMPATVPAGRFGGLRSVLASAWARVRRAM
jgi:hypothetical protein